MTVRKLVVAVLVVAVVGLVVYSFLSRTSDGEAIPTTPTPSTTSSGAATTTVPTDVETVERPAAAHVAEEVARQGLTVAFTWYPSIDATQNDAYGRARSWLTDKLADRMIIDAHTERGPSVQWAEWGRQEAKIIADVSVECSGCPEDTDTSVQRVATVKQTAIVGTNTTTVEPDTTVWVTLVREGDRWLIDDIRY